MHFMLLQKVFPFEKWLPHFDAKCFGFIGTGYGAAVVIGENDDGFAPKFGIKNAFAGCKKIVAIQKGEKICDWWIGS
jgi:hypothetical protein